MGNRLVCAVLLANEYVLNIKKNVLGRKRRRNWKISPELCWPQVREIFTYSV